MISTPGNSVRGPKTVSTANKDLLLKKINIPHAKNTLWPVEKKIEVVTSWLTLGNLRQAAAIGGMSHSLVKQWRTQPWWKDLEAEILASRRIASATKLSKIVDKSLDVIDDRLENGDFVYNAKTGDLLRKPVSMRDAGNVANSLMQRQAILEKLTRDETVAETAISIQDQLSNLALEFAKFNNRGKAQAETIEYKEVDAIQMDDNFGTDDTGISSLEEDLRTDMAGQTP